MFWPCCTVSSEPLQYKTNIFLFVCPNPRHSPVLHVCPFPISPLQTPVRPSSFSLTSLVFDVRSICMSRLRRGRKETVHREEVEFSRYFNVGGDLQSQHHPDLTPRGINWVWQGMTAAMPWFQGRKDSMYFLK